MAYSPKFQQLVSNPEQVQKLFAGSSFGARDLSKWENCRKFIAQTINKSGTILDIGCGNGFLLRCLQEWQNQTLIPHGIDTNPEYLNQAKLLFPEYSQNFALLSIENLDKLASLGLPDKYDLIYWNVWDNWDFGTDRKIELFKNVLDCVSPGGRLILGLYYTESQYNLSKVHQLESHGFVPSGTIQNSARWEIVCWFDK